MVKSNRVLIVCTGNSCRSQMAEAIWRNAGGERWLVDSAGSRPSGFVHPLAIVALQELDLPVDRLTSKSTQLFVDQEFDLVITVCDNAKESCPIIPGAKQTLHWPFDDPADCAGSDEEKKVVFRRVRDEIKNTIESFLNSQRKSIAQQNRHSDK